MPQCRERDKFYVRYDDIAAEMAHYDPKYFQGKTVYCPCDDPKRSDFTKYFLKHYDDLGLKRLISTNYDVGNGARVLDTDTGMDIKALHGDGSLRSAECIAYRDQADIIVTYPAPKIQFGDFVAWVGEAGAKEFLLVTFLEWAADGITIPMLNRGEMWAGYESIERLAYYDGELSNLQRTPFTWWNNFNRDSRPKKIVPTKVYVPEEYPRYEGSDVIKVTRTSMIPRGYDGMMTVSFCFLRTYNPDQYEIIGRCGSPRAAKKCSYVHTLSYPPAHNGHECDCLIIRAKKQQHPDAEEKPKPKPDADVCTEEQLQPQTADGSDAEEKPKPQMVGEHYSALEEYAFVQEQARNEKDRMAKYIGSLKDPDVREIMKRRYLNGYSDKHIQDAMQIDTKKYYYLLGRGAERIETMMDGHQDQQVWASARTAHSTWRNVVKIRGTVTSIQSTGLSQMIATVKSTDDIEYQIHIWQDGTSELKNDGRYVIEICARFYTSPNLDYANLTMIPNSSVRRCDESEMSQDYSFAASCIVEGTVIGKHEEDLGGGKTMALAMVLTGEGDRAAKALVELPSNISINEGEHIRVKGKPEKFGIDRHGGEMYKCRPDEIIIG